MRESYEKTVSDQLWENALKETPPQANGDVGKLIKTWAESLESEIISVDQDKEIAIFLLDLSNLMLKGLETNVLIVAQPPESIEKESEFFHLLEYHAEKAATAHCLCFLIFLQNEIKISKSSLPELLDVVVLGGNDIKKQLNFAKPQNLLFETIIQQIGSSRLCPFDTTRPARGEMFVGRKNELKQLIQEFDTSFIVTGSRRVGKSSLIRKGAEILGKKFENSRDRFFLMDCETWGHYESCCRQIANQIDIKYEVRIDKGSQNMLNLFKLKSFHGKRPLILFFDEFDRMADIDRRDGWRFLKIIHTCVDKGWLKAVFVGYRSVSSIYDANDSPFFESIKLLKLQPLEEREANELLIKPFQRVGIEILETDQIVKKIVINSAKLPFIIQFYGENLFYNLEKKQNRKLSLEDVEEFEGSFKFSDFVQSFFMENTNQDERLLSLLYAYHGGKNAWVERDFYLWAEKIGIQLTMEEIFKSCRNLVLANILTIQNNQYSFQFPFLKKLLNKRWGKLNLKELYSQGGLKT